MGLLQARGSTAWVSIDPGRVKAAAEVVASAKQKGVRIKQLVEGIRAELEQRRRCGA